MYASHDHIHTIHTNIARLLRKSLFQQVPAQNYLVVEFKEFLFFLPVSRKTLSIFYSFAFVILLPTQTNLSLILHIYSSHISYSLALVLSSSFQFANLSNFLWNSDLLYSLSKPTGLLLIYFSQLFRRSILQMLRHFFNLTALPLIVSTTIELGHNMITYYRAFRLITALKST